MEKEHERMQGDDREGAKTNVFLWEQEDDEAANAYVKHFGWN